jgi:hypothetical protein
MDYMHTVSKYEKYKRFDEYIWANYSYINKNEKSSLTKEYINDIVKLSNILGRLEVYLLDKQDIQTADLICKWFEKEFEDEYSMEDFKDWLNDNE